MKKSLLTFLGLLIAISGFAQSWSNTGNSLQRRIVSTDTSYRFNLGSPGFMYFPTFPQLNNRLILKANKDSTYNINKNFYDVPNKPLSKVNLGIFEYLGEWNSSQASASYYNRVGCLVSYQGVLYRIILNPNTQVPGNGNINYFTVVSNAIGQNVLKSFAIGAGNRYDFFTLKNPATQQLAIKFIISIVYAPAPGTGRSIESQQYDLNLQGSYSVTPNTWFELTPTKYSTFNNSFGDTTKVKNRFIFIDFQYNPTNIGSPLDGGTFKFRYRINNNLGITGTLAIRNYATSNNDLLTLDNYYTDSDTPALFGSKTVILDNGFVLSSPDGTQYKITVANGGIITVTAL